MASVTHWATIDPAIADDRDWPRTTRVLPWLAALAIGTVLLVPIDSMTLPIPLPFDARPDRLLLVACFSIWALVALVRLPAGSRGTGYRYGAVEVLLVALAGVAVLSVARSLNDLEILGEASLAVGKLVLLGSYLGFYLLIVGTVRASEVQAFVRLVVALATIAAIGTILEYATGHNLFFSLASTLSPPGTRVTPSDLVAPGGRPDVTGPARHGLAVSAMLAMILPLAVVGAAFARARRDRILYGAAALLLFGACITTFRRSGIVLPFIACSAVTFGGGRRMLPVVGVFVVLLTAVPVLAPGAVSEITAQFSTTTSDTARESIQGRTADYPAVVPDVRATALLGRGFGSYEARRYRFLDNQYITMLIETGIVGTVLYLLVILSGAARGLRLALRRAGPAHWIGLAAFGSCLAYLAANAFFDTIAFPQAPYAFLLVVALAGIARQEEISL